MNGLDVWAENTLELPRETTDYMHSELYEKDRDLIQLWLSSSPVPKGATEADYTLFRAALRRFEKAVYAVRQAPDR